MPVQQKTMEYNPIWKRHIAIKKKTLLSFFEVRGNIIVILVEPKTKEFNPNWLKHLVYTLFFVILGMNNLICQLKR